MNVALTEKLSVTYKVNDVSTTFPVKIAYISPKVSTVEDLALGIAFQLDKNIAIAVAGEAGTEVTLRLNNGRIETVTIGANGEAIFRGLYVNEFFGTLTITAGNETYTYSLENYLNAMENDHPEKVPAIKALYTYTYYANDYVENVVNKAQ